MKLYSLLEFLKWLDVFTISFSTTLYLQFNICERIELQIDTSLIIYNSQTMQVLVILLCVLQKLANKFTKFWATCVELLLAPLDICHVLIAVAMTVACLRFQIFGRYWFEPCWSPNFSSFFSSSFLSQSQSEDLLISLFLSEDLFTYFSFNPLTLMSDQDRISPHNINQISDENKEKYQFGEN